MSSMPQALPELSLMLEPLWLSVKLAGVTTICLIVLATPIAYWLAMPATHWLKRCKTLIMGMIALPLVLPPTVIGFYMLLLLSPNSAMGSWLAAHGIASLAFTFEGLVLGSIIYSLPFYVQPVYAQFLRIPQNVIEMGLLLEPSRLQRFMRVALPQVKAGIILGSLISFAHTIGEFGVVLMIGGSIAGETKVISIAMYEQVEALNYQTAHLMAALLIALGMLLVSLIAVVNKQIRH